MSPRSLKQALEVVERWAREKRFGDVTVSFRAGKVVLIRTTETHKVDGRTDGGQDVSSGD